MRKSLFFICLFFALAGCEKEPTYPYAGTYKGSLRFTKTNRTGSVWNYLDTVYKNVTFTVKPGSEKYSYMIVRMNPDTILFDKLQFDVLGKHESSYSGGRNPEQMNLTSYFKKDSLSLTRYFRSGAGYYWDSIQIKAARLP